MSDVELAYSARTADPAAPLVSPDQPIAANAKQIAETDDAKVMTALERTVVAFLRLALSASLGKTSNVSLDEDGNILLQVTKEDIAHPAFEAVRDKTESAYAALVGAVLSRSGGGRTSNVTADEDGNMTLQISKEDIGHPLFEAVREKAEATFAAMTGAVSPLSGLGRDGGATVDGASNLFQQVTRDALSHPVLENHEDRIAGNETRLGYDYSAASFLAMVAHLIGYGQSLMEADYAIPPISTSARAYDRGFVGGRRPTDSGAAPDIYASLIPGVEVGGGRNSSGETPLAGCIDMIAQLMLSERGIDLTTANQQRFLGSVAAFGGKSQDQLSVGTSYFNEWKDHISYGRQTTEAAGLSYCVGAALHSQGEADYNNNTGRGAWAAGQRKMRLDMQAHAQSVCRNDRPLPMVMAQTMTHLAHSRAVPAIALAQEDLAREQWFATFPIHFMQYHTDNVHLTATSSRWQGAYYGLYLYRWLLDRVKPSLAPIRCERSGSSAILTFPVSAGRKIVLDGAMAALTTNYGFTVTDPYGAALTIASVTQIANDKIAITAAGTIGRVRNGWIGTAYKGISCVRDDSPLIFDPSGINKPMQLWAPIFERIVQ